MGLSKPQAFVLFALGRCYEECDRRFADKPLVVNMNKKAFIELARAANMVSKGERAMYKNLEDLEQKRLISYESKSLKLTDRGESRFQEILSKVEPYLAVSLLLRSENVLKYAKVQSKLAKTL
ncbi:MAG: hypothetical protein NTW67_01795 [Candidatus Woesearchaeota archaeon]|nr:hypothetical protein [Candidatus Woesearchaeota archaeon]